MNSHPKYSPTQHNGTISEQFVTFIRTKQFMKNRLHGENDRDPVHINQKEITDRFFTWPKHNLKLEIQKLIDAGEISVSVEQLQNGYKQFMYCVLKPGAINLTLLKPKQIKFDKITTIMKQHLNSVSLPTDAPRTDYFAFFLKHKDNYPDYFFTVDDFAGRVHTPVSSFHKEYRPNILITNEITASIDIATMQPLLLGKILKNEIGANEYSNWIDQGKDIYIMIQQAAGLETRDHAKKKFFEILFGKPNNGLANLLGNGGWITWINEYKSKPEPLNPKGSKVYNNLAWLLQTYEVRIMRKIWNKLMTTNIVFLSVHDEIICRQTDLKQAEHIMCEVLSNEFTYFKLNIDFEEITDTFKTINCNYQSRYFIGSDGLLYMNLPY